LAIGVDASYEAAQGLAALMSDLSQALPEHIFKTDTGPVLRNNDRSLDY
jgi:hypothetical protein